MLLPVYFQRGCTTLFSHCRWRRPIYRQNLALAVCLIGCYYRPASSQLILSKKLVTRWDTQTWHRSILLPLLRLTPPTEGFPGTISVKFCTEVKRWLRYKMAKKYCRKFQRPEYVARTLQADNRYRRICDVQSIISISVSINQSIYLS